MAAAECDEQRYRLLFERHWRRVLAYALRRCASPAAAEDIVSEVFLTAWRRIQDIPAEYELPWLLSVARRILANAHRGDLRRERLLARLHQTAPDPVVDEVEMAAGQGDIAERVQTVLARLRPADAELLQLATWEELSHSEIAAVLDCSVNAVAIRLHRARQRLGEELAKELGGHHRRVGTKGPHLPAGQT